MGLEFQAECDSVNDYMKICNIPTTMRRTARGYMATRRNLSSKNNEGDILKLLSPTLRQQFLIHNYSSLVRSVLPLAGAPNSFIVGMASIAAMKLYGPSEAITFQNSRGDPFYTLRQGEIIMCRYYSPGLPMQFVNRMRNFGFWNERLLAYDSFTDCSVKAVGFVEALAFDSAGVREMLKRFPQGMLRVKQIVLRRLWKFAASKESTRHAIHALGKDIPRTPPKNSSPPRKPESMLSLKADTGFVSHVQACAMEIPVKPVSKIPMPSPPRVGTWSDALGVERDYLL